MPYNRSGDLYKTDVVQKLNEKGCNVKNVHALNLILEKMGLLENAGKCWITTDEGVKYTSYQSRCAADAWHSSVIDAVYDYLMSR